MRKKLDFVRFPDSFYYILPYIMMQLDQERGNLDFQWFSEFPAKCHHYILPSRTKEKLVFLRVFNAFSYILPCGRIKTLIFQRFLTFCEISFPPPRQGITEGIIHKAFKNRYWGSLIDNDFNDFNDF